MNSVLVYHTISSPDEPLPGEIDISPEAFARQLKWLARWSAVAPLIETLGNGNRRNRVAITFDDGFRDNLTVALPLLEKYSMPATVFVTAGFVDTADYLSTGDLSDLSKHPLITIGGHGLWHSHLNLLSSDQVRHELVESRRMLEAIVKQTVDLMAWPYGECDPRLEQLANESGYRASWSVWKGENSQHSRWRVPLGRRDNLARFVLKVSGCYAVEASRHRFLAKRQQRSTQKEFVNQNSNAVGYELK